MPSVGSIADDQEILRQPVHRRVAEHRERRLLELDRDLGALDAERLAGAQVERHAGPAPVVDGQLQRGIGLGGAAGLDVLGLAIVLDLGVADLAGAILPAHRILQRLRFALGLDRRQHVGLFRAHRMRVELGRRLHRHQRQQLKQMVRHHVAQRAGGVVEAAAMADAELFVDRDLDMIDVIAIPDRLEHAVGEAQHQDVLHRLLAEIMIDPVDLMFVDEFQQFAVQRLAPRRGRCRTAFRPPAAATRHSLAQHAGAAELLADRQRRRRAASPDRTGDCRRSCLTASSLSSCSRMASNEAGSFGSASMQVTQASSRLAMASSTFRVANWCRPFIRLSRSSSLDMRLAGDADDAEIVRQQVVGREIVERRNHQPVREVAGDAEDHEGAGIGLFLRRVIDGHRRQAFGLTMSGAFCCTGAGCCCGSLWPPKPSRIADRIFSAKVCSLRERKRANSAAVSTSAGTASSMAALTVQRPSPESST